MRRVGVGASAGVQVAAGIGAYVSATFLWGAGDDVYTSYTAGVAYRFEIPR